MAVWPPECHVPVMLDGGCVRHLHGDGIRYRNAIGVIILIMSGMASRRIGHLVLRERYAAQRLCIAIPSVGGMVCSVAGNVLWDIAVPSSHDAHLVILGSWDPGS